MPLTPSGQSAHQLFGRSQTNDEVSYEQSYEQAYDQGYGHYFPSHSFQDEENARLWNATEEPQYLDRPRTRQASEEYPLTADPASFDNEPSLAPTSGRHIISEEGLAEARASFNEGTRLLRGSETQDALRLLSRAQALFEQAGELPYSSTEEEKRSHAAIRAEVASNLGICHRRLGELGSAVRYLQIGLKFHKAASSPQRTLVAAHLNLASCHLEMEAPKAALGYANAAVELAAQILAGPDASCSDDMGDATQSTPVGEPTENDFAMLAVAFHKVAESQEGLREWGKASQAYNQANEVVQRSLGSHHPLAKSLVVPRWKLGDKGATGAPGATSLINQRLIASVAACQSGAGSIVRPGSRAAQFLLPHIPLSARGKANLLSTNACELQGYEIPREVLPSWPPPKLTKDEKIWYAMARSSKRNPIPGSPLSKEPRADAFIFSHARSK